MSSKHTPGPWKLVSKNAARNFNAISVRPVISPVKGIVLPIAKVSRFMPQNMAEANANLIAAAPDLLDNLIAAEALLQWFAESPSLTNTRGEATIHAALPEIRAAIAKATGEVQ